MVLVRSVWQTRGWPVVLVEAVRLQTTQLVRSVVMLFVAVPVAVLAAARATQFMGRVGTVESREIAQAV
mgnify:CR=1 FL=1